MMSEMQSTVHGQIQAHLPSTVKRSGLLGLYAFKVLQLGVCQL